jgi:hypothetical protein
MKRGEEEDPIGPLLQYSVRFSSFGTRRYRSLVFCDGIAPRLLLVLGAQILTRHDMIDVVFDIAYRTVHTVAHLHIFSADR